MRRLLLVVVGVMVACTPIKKKKNLENLEPSVLRFYTQLKWYRGGLAKNFILPPQRPAFLDEMDEASRKLKLSRIKIIRITPYAKDAKAVVRIRVVWHHVDEGLVHETLIEEQWKRVKTSWYREKSKRVRGKKIPWIFK